MFFPSRVTRRRMEISAKAAYSPVRLPSELSKISSMLACVTGLRVLEPLKMTSVIDSPRRFFAELSPITQRSVYFDLNSADIKGDYDPALRAHARYLADHPNARVRIEGNADERGSAEYNRRLGLKRAENVRASLVAQGAGDKQVRIKSLGEARPKVVGHDEASWSENRRADVVYEVEN